MIMWSKTLAALFIFLLPGIYTVAQTKQASGKLPDINAEPVAAASIQNLPSGKGTITDAKLKITALNFETFFTNISGTAFLLMVILAVTGMMIGIYYWRRNYYRQINRLLKEKVDAATLELQLINNTLEKKVDERTWAIHEAEKKFRTLVEKSLVGVYIIQDYAFHYVNPRFAEIFGYANGELHGKSPLCIIKEDLRDIVNEKIKLRISGEVESDQYEIEGIKKDGTDRLLEFFGSRTIYEGKPTIIGTVLDITEKRLLEKEIVEQKIQEQKKITRAILQGEERERNKIGQELHDNINQILAAAKLSLGIARDLPANKEFGIVRSMELVDNAITEIRTLSHEFVSPLKGINLKELLQDLVDILQINTAINTTLIYKEDEEQIDDDMKLNIYRIAQEQLNNIIKYAKASNVIVTVAISTANISLSIIDDGNGFDTKTKRKGIGLNNIINRVKSFNGTVKIESSPGKGCSINIMLPRHGI